MGLNRAESFSRSTVPLDLSCFQADYFQDRTTRKDDLIVSWECLFRKWGLTLWLRRSEVWGKGLGMGNAELRLGVRGPVMFMFASMNFECRYLF